MIPPGPLYLNPTLGRYWYVQGYLAGYVFKIYIPEYMGLEENQTEYGLGYYDGVDRQFAETELINLIKQED